MTGTTSSPDTSARTVPVTLSAQPDAEPAAGLSSTIGIETKGGVFTALISRGTLLPASRTEIFTTADRDQTSIKMMIFQGERALAKQNRRLGLFEISGLPAWACWQAADRGHLQRGRKPRIRRNRQGPEDRREYARAAALTAVPPPAPRGELLHCDREVLGDSCACSVGCGQDDPVPQVAGRARGRAAEGGLTVPKRDEVQAGRQLARSVTAYDK